MKITKILACVALFLTVGTGIANAVSTNKNALELSVGGKPNSVKAYKIDLPASFAVNDSCFVVLPAPALTGMVSNDADGGGSVNFVLGFSATAAGDSVDTQIQASVDGSNWITISALTKENIGGLIGSSAPYDIVDDGAISTYIPANFWRFLVKNKGSTLTSKQYFITFYRIPG